MVAPTHPLHSRHVELAHALLGGGLAPERVGLISRPATLEQCEARWGLTAILRPGRWETGSSP